MMVPDLNVSVVNSDKVEIWQQTQEKKKEKRLKKSKMCWLSLVETKIFYETDVLPTALRRRQYFKQIRD